MRRLHSRKLISLVISNGCPIRGIYLQLNSKYYNFLYVKWILYKNISAALSNIALFVIFVRTLNFFSQFFLYFSTLTHFSFVRFLLRLLPTAPAAALAALERPSVSPWTALCVTLNGPLCLTYSLFVLELLTVCRLASWPSVAWPPDRLSPGLLTVCAGLLSRSSISKSPVNLHLQYFFIPMFLLWRFYLFKSVLWNWLKVLWYRFMCLLLLDKCFFAITFVKFFKNVHCICVTCKPKACVIKSTSCRNVESFFVTSNLHTC
jgi:hypothetical protein